MTGSHAWNDGPSGGARPGDLLAGKYRVERVIGQGGMGVVVVAHHEQLDEKVAIKFLLPEALKNAEAVGRFAREARAAVKIKSEHVARVIDVGQLENGSPYMVMEYLEGSDLSAMLAERGPMPVEQAVGFILQACEALAEAHVLGIVHRDLKPANLFLANRPSGPPIVKVLDFGISKSAFSTSQAQLTRTSAVMGSPLYMSPEQMQSSKTVDVRSDIWALGVVLYELLTGSAPFQADTFPELIVAIFQGEFPPLRTVRPDIPAAFESTLNRCLVKDPAGRFANVGELAAALAPFGPPRSDVSVERISHVLGSGAPRPMTHVGPPRVAAVAAVAVLARAGDLSVSPIAGTLPGVAPTLHAGATPLRIGTSGRNSGIVGAATTSKPVSSSPVVPAGLPSRGAGRFALVAAGFVAVLGIGGVGAWRATATHRASTQGASAAGSTAPAPSASQAATAVPPPPSPSAAPSVTPTVAASLPQAASPSQTAASPTTPPAAHPARTPWVPTHPAAASPPPPPPVQSPATPKANCNPPYTLDSENHRRYKPECY